MNHLHRELAPISDAAWGAIEREAKARLATHLAARKLVDFAGPHGWSHSAANLGRSETIPAVLSGVAAAQRQVLPLVELRAEFTIARAEIDDVERGAIGLDLAQMGEATRRIALAENMTVFHGYPAARMRGITETTSHEPIVLEQDIERYPNDVARATDVLRQAGVNGPYGLAISPEIYTRIVETTEHGGYLLFDHLRHILGGSLIWSPGVQGGIVLSLRSGDFLLECGEDLSIGYIHDDAELVHLYLEESLSFRVVEPDAAVALRLAT